MRICYVRFGRKSEPFPENERSWNVLTQQYEDGVSVYEAIERNGNYQIILPKMDGTTLATLGMCYNVAQGLSGQTDNPLYEVTGDVVGHGYDGEPVLRNCKVVKKIFHGKLDTTPYYNPALTENTCEIVCDADVLN